MANAKIKNSKAAEPYRFAHPFFGAETEAERPMVSGVGRRLIDHIEGTLQKVPPPKRAPSMTLAEIIGTAASNAIAATGTLRFHTAGDTGLPPAAAETPQQRVADAMTLDFPLATPQNCPAFFFHLGDVVYGTNKDANYRGQFYEPYRHYPGKIVGIPGNHDGEVFPSTDSVSLRAYIANFCTDKAVVPPIAGSTFRQTVTQPSVYWLLDAPFVQIIGLYSNTAENPGFISGAIPGPAQKAWLISTLKSIRANRAKGTRKFLLFATHHPPFSSGGHSGSADMLADIDDACQRAGGVMPDLFLSGHSHSYQRYTRFVTAGAATLAIPYLIVGCAGHGAQSVVVATGTRTGNLTFEKSFEGFGYAHVSATAKMLTLDFYSVDGTTGAKNLFDTVSVQS